MVECRHPEVQIVIITFPIVLPRQFLNLHALKKKVHIQSIIDYGPTLRDSSSANDLKPWLVYIRDRSRQFTPRTITPAVPDYNFLSTLLLKERLNYNKGILIHNIMSGKVPLSLTAKLSLNQSRHYEKLSMPIPRTFSSLASYILVVFFGTHSLTVLLLLLLMPCLSISFYHNISL